jgi:hypothetical protein
MRLTRQLIFNWILVVGLIAPALRIAASQATPVASSFSAADEQLLEEIERTAFRYFWETGDPVTGLVKDRSRADGPDKRKVASIAATGFGLTALCIAEQRDFFPADEIRERVLTTLRFLAERMTHEHGFFFHFVDATTGERIWKCELSSIDTAILLCGVLACRQHFNDPEIRELSRRIYERVDWRWMLDGGSTLSHGWKPESGFLRSRWDEYCELMMLYLLALGSPTYPIPAEAWAAWSRKPAEYAGVRYIGGNLPLFVHQYSHAWFDFRDRQDANANYFENSVAATRAHQRFCASLNSRFPSFDSEVWGITASDSARGYVAWGGPPEVGPLDGTLVPCAAGGSIPFLPNESILALRRMRERFGDKIWQRYGFVDAFNPHTGWTNPDVIGIDVGITMLMAENARTEFVWRTFMKNPEMERAFQKAGFTSRPAATIAQTVPAITPVVAAKPAP